jgi:hypothetical protein
VLSPALFLDYQCAIPKDMMDALDIKGSAFTSTISLPCENAKFGKEVFADFKDKNLVKTSTYVTYKDMMSLMCGALGGEAYLGVVLFLEIITLILCLMFGVRVFNHPIKFSFFLFCSAVLWGAWPIILTIQYESFTSAKFTCYIPYRYGLAVCV